MVALLRWVAVGADVPKGPVTLQDVHGVYFKVSIKEIMYAMRQIDPREVMAFAADLHALERVRAKDRRARQTAAAAIAAEAARSVEAQR